MEEEPEPPLIGWTMREAVAALLPDLLADADERPPRDWWMAGGTEYKFNERAKLRRMFAQIMEAGQYRATGLVKWQEQWIAPALWRAATFGLELPGERVLENTLYAGGKSFKGVRVRLPALLEAQDTRAVAGGGGAVEGRAFEAGTIWWTACEAYTWVAFREARKLTGNIEFPRAEWSRDWIQWPPRCLSAAFVEICTGTRPLTEADPLSLDSVNAESARDYALSWAWRVINATKESAERLNDLLIADIEQCERNQDTLGQAYRDVMAAVRAGRLTVLARKCFENGQPNISAEHEALDHKRVFLGPRGISIFGKVDYAGPEATGFEFLDYKGPFYDEAQFEAGEVQALWPAVVKVRPGTLEWMTAAAKAFLAKKGGKPKRDALVRDCVEALGCSTREAEAAYKQLPDHLRRKRGEKG